MPDSNPKSDEEFVQQPDTVAAEPDAAQTPLETENDSEGTENTVLVVGGGVAGLAAATALADAGFRVTVLERRGYLGGRASSYLHPGTGEIIDNCQHVLFGCCTNLISFYQRIGVANRIFWDSKMTLIEPGGRRSVLAPAGLPSPMHGLPGILASKCYSIADKLSLVFAFMSILLGPKPRHEQSLGDWLESHLQSKGALERFWRLVIASALNADLEHISLPIAAKVIRQVFLNSETAGFMGMSTIPLSGLYDGARAYLEARKGRIVFNANVASAAWDDESRSWTVTAQERSHRAEQLVLALPFEATAKLLPNLPSNPDAAALAKTLSTVEHRPICSAHLWFDREITELDHAVLLDRDIHWMYHKSRWQPSRDAKASYVELVVSGSREFAALSKEQALERATSQLAEFFPEVRRARVLKSALIKEMRATFLVPPTVDAVHVGPVSPWPNCFLAGDWTDTDWAATMESATRSGYLAAEALCRSQGDPRAILVPDLPPTGLMKLFG